MKPGLLGMRTFTISLSVLAFFVPALSAQNLPSRDSLLVAAREVIDSARYCGLVTLDDAGHPRARTMDPFSPDEDWSVWMGTNRNTRKVEDIRRNPRVTLYYFSPDLVGYVSVYGMARLVDDPAEKATRWKDDWEGLYRDREADYLLIQVIPDRMEVIDYARGIVGDPETWEPPSVAFPGPPSGPQLAG